jgi:hypothetical protein
MVTVEGYNGGVKSAEASVTLTASHIEEGAVTVTVSLFSSSGVGSVNLGIAFPAFNAAPDPDTPITAVEITLYSSLEDYASGNACRFERYRKDSGFGEGTNFTETSLTLAIDPLPSGNYVARIEFFREKYVKIKTLVQTIIVRDGLITDRWDGGGSTLSLGESDFASSNANLANLTGISIVSGFSSTTYGYSILDAWTAAPPALTITRGRPGQKIEATLNGTAVSTGTQLEMGVNSLSVVVTAPDGVTRQSYSVSYTYYYDGTVWFVDGDNGNDANYGISSGTALKTVGAALTKIRDAYSGSTWEGKGTPQPVPALIRISGNITTDTSTDTASLIRITDSGLYANLPPIILAGNGAGDHKINAQNSGRALYIENAEVILGDNLTITGGNLSGNGGGVYVNGGSFTMNGGAISENTGSSGGGVYVTNGGSFVMNGGAISENTGSTGGGVYVNGGSFVMNGGAISQNTCGGSGSSGGGVYITNGSFVMYGGTISENGTSYRGGGVSVRAGSFIMHGGSLSENTSVYGGGVYLDTNGIFTMNGGSVSGNSSNANGGGVHINRDSSGTAELRMNGGSVSGNSTPSSGGGVYITNGSFVMYGGSVSGNTANNGGGVCTEDTSEFRMTGGIISGNSSQSNGGGVEVKSSYGFTMSGGNVSGNTAPNGKGGGVYVTGSGGFIMSGGSISGNATPTNRGGGVYVTSGSFEMNGGSITGNSANNGGGVGVDVSGSFFMNGGSLSGNTADTSGGGAVVDGNSSVFEMNGGSLSGNTADTSGGGVAVSGGGGFSMSEGSISGNSLTNTSASGGGVYVTDSGGFTMDGGSVSGNTAVFGGGVYVAGSTTNFEMSGGSIGGNTATSNGGGVSVNTGSTFAMSDSAEVDSGNTVYLASGRVITLSSALMANPAANIEPAPGADTTTQLLGGPDISTGNPPNYQRFLVNGEAGKIASNGNYLGP